MDENFELPEDLQDVQVIYSDEFDEDEEGYDDEFAGPPPEDSNELEAEVVDMAKLTFKKHKISVFTSSLSQDNKLAVTGGEDDMAYVWDTSSGEIVMECTGHKDSVTEVAFNHDSKLVATADMAGLIQVWDVKEKKLVWCFEGDDMAWLTWHPQINALVCGCQSGEVYIWQIPDGKCKVLPSINNAPTSCGKFLPNGKEILIGYDDGNLRLWNIKDTNVNWCNNEAETITNLDISPDGNLAFICPKSLLIKISDGKTVGKLMVEGETETETCLFSPDNLLITGALSGLATVWDISRQALRHQHRFENAITILKWGKNGQVFIAANEIYICDAKSGTLLHTFTGHLDSILSLQIFNDGQSFLTTSDDGMAKIFQIST